MLITSSFRDPSGRLYLFDEKVIRVVSDPTSAKEIETFLATTTAQAILKAGRLVDTKDLNAAQSVGILENLRSKGLLDGEPPDLVLEHERIEFPSYPYEWPPEMLFEAGRLTLDLAARSLSDDFCLKDATPYNVLFRGPSAVFIDLPSFERRDPHDPTWLPYAQFVRTFLMPLLVNRHFGISQSQVFVTHRDGLEPESVYQMSAFFRRMFPTFLGLVSIPVWLGRRKEGQEKQLYEKRHVENPEKARFIVESLLRGLRRKLARLRPKTGRKSGWSDYMHGEWNYTDECFEDKVSFMEEAFDEMRPKRVLDVGCNTGFFSMMAAEKGAGVVAIDYDPVVVGRLWRQAKEKDLDILPLVVDLARPSPGIGWRNRECPSFLDRAEGRFDVVLMLAVIHHMLVTERIPLRDILKQAWDLTRGSIVIEFVGREDSMFQRLLRGRGHLFSDWGMEFFESECQRFFDLVSKRQLQGGQRCLYVFQRKAVHS